MLVDGQDESVIQDNPQLALLSIAQMLFDLQAGAHPNDMQRKVWKDFIAGCVSHSLAPAFYREPKLPDLTRWLHHFFTQEVRARTVVQQLIGADFESDQIEEVKLVVYHQCLILGAMFDVLQELLPFQPTLAEGQQLSLEDVNALAERVCTRLHRSIRQSNIDAITQSEHTPAVQALLKVTPATFRDFADRITLGTPVEQAQELEALFPVYEEGPDTTGRLFSCLASPRFRNEGEVFIDLHTLLQRLHGADVLNILPQVNQLLRDMTRDLNSKLPDIRVRFRPTEVEREAEEEQKEVLILQGPSEGGAVLAAVLQAACGVPLRRRLVYTLELPDNTDPANRCQLIGGIDTKSVAIVREYSAMRKLHSDRERLPCLVVASSQGNRAFENLCTREGIDWIYVDTPQDFLTEARLRREFFLPQNPVPTPSYYRERPESSRRLREYMSQPESRALILICGERSSGKTRLWSRCCEEIFSGRLQRIYRGGIVLDFLTDRSIAGLFVTLFNDLLERTGHEALYHGFEQQEPEEIEARVDRILHLLKETGGHYLLVLENLEMALREDISPYIPEHPDLTMLLRKIAAHPSPTIKIVALSARHPDLCTEWTQEVHPIDLGQGDLPIREEAIPLLKEVGAECPALNAATDAQLETLLEKMRTSAPFDILLLADAFRKKPELRVATYLWPGRQIAIDRSWHSLHLREQVALLMIHVVSPLLPLEDEIVAGSGGIITSSDPFDLSRLIQLGFVGRRLPGPDDQGPALDIVDKEKMGSLVVSLLAEVVSYIRRQETSHPYTQAVFQWGANYCFQILNRYNDQRNQEISALAFLKFENDYFLTAAGSWLHGIAGAGDPETARVQWLTFVFKTVLWWDEYTRFPPTYRLLELWQQTPFYQSADGKLTFELMSRFLTDYPRSNAWRTRDREIEAWEAVANSLSRLRRHIGLDGPYPTENEAALRQLRMMIDDYYAEALWQAGKEGAEEIYLEAIEAYASFAELRWAAPFNHSELAEFYLSKGYIALAFQQCRLALVRGEQENKWSKNPVAPEEPETLVWIYRVLSDVFFQFYRQTGESHYIEASVVAMQLAAWYVFVFQAVPHPADDYTVQLAEEIYLRGVLRFREASGGDQSRFALLCANLQRLWTQSQTSIEVVPLPAELASADEETLRRALYPVAAELAETSRQSYANCVRKAALEKNVRRQIWQWRALLNKRLKQAISTAKAQPMFHRIRSREDRYVGDFLDLFQQNFPLYEKVRLSEVWKEISAPDPSTQTRMEVLLKPEPDPQARRCEGMLWMDVDARNAVAFVWYFAIRDKNRGLGSQVWQMLVQRLRTEGIKAIVWEVERPDHAEDPQTARRRIRFYRRQGGQLTDAEYMQHVKWREPTPMYLMIQPLIPMSPARQRALLRQVAGSALTSIDAIDVEPKD